MTVLHGKFEPLISTPGFVIKVQLPRKEFS